MTEPTDRRAAERFAVNADTSCTFFSPVVEDFPRVRVVNISMDGIGLLVSRTIKPGTLLTVTLANPARGLTKTVLVRAVHATPQPGGCMVGGTFTTPLTYQELTALVM
jgi:PilZ domain